VEREFDSHLPRVLCHAGRINQVFMNILTNAAQAIDKTGTIRICASPIEPNSVRISITDSGRGIAPEHLDKITDPFFTTKEVGEGTGLGLWISENIVQAHGGRLQCSSCVGQGSTFTVELPIHPPNA
jgi:signal transduction histidine kinase